MIFVGSATGVLLKFDSSGSYWNKLVFELLNPASSRSILVLVCRKNLLRDDWEALQS